MKNYNKIFGILGLICFLFVLQSCESEEDIFFRTSDAEGGGFLNFETTNTNSFTVPFDDPANASFTDVLIDENNNVESVTYNVTANISGVAYTIENFGTYEGSFPTEYTIRVSDIVDQIPEITLDDVFFGDSFDFIAVVKRNDGTLFYGTEPVFNTDILALESLGNTNTELLNSSGYQSAMKFTMILACPVFTVDDVIGTYEVVDLGFAGTVGNTFEVIAGANPDEIVLIEPYNSTTPYNVTIQVDFNTSVGTLDDQVAYDSDPYAGTPIGTFNPTTLTGSGFVLPCADLISFTNNESTLVRAADGASFSWNNDPSLVARKIN